MKHPIVCTLALFSCLFISTKAQSSDSLSKSGWAAKLYISAGYVNKTMYLSNPKRPYMDFKSFFLGTPTFAVQRKFTSGDFAEVGITSLGFSRSQYDHYFTDSGSAPVVSHSQHNRFLGLGLSGEYAWLLANNNRFRLYVSTGSFFQLYHSHDKDRDWEQSNTTLSTNVRISSHFQFDFSNRMGVDVALPLISALYTYDHTKYIRTNSTHPTTEPSTLSVFPNRYVMRLGLYCKF